MSRNIEELHPRLQEKVAQLQTLCNKEGLQLGIGECFRSAAEQNELYAQGRTKAGAIITNAPGSSYSSQHQWGIAFDFFKNVRGHEYDDNAFFTRVGQLGKSIGLGWGGDWHSIVDKPHLYLPDWGSGTSVLKSKYGNFDNFKKTWGTASVTPIKPAQPVVETPWKATGTATCGGDGVRVRMIPNGNVILQLNKGQRFEVNGEISGKWVKIKVQNTIGWMHSNYVKYDKPVPAAKPAAQPAQQTTSKIILKADGLWGASTTKRLQQYFGLSQDGKISNQLNAYKHLSPGILSAEWSNTPNGGSMLVRKMQEWVGKSIDGYIGAGFNIGLQSKFGKTQDGVLSKPSQTITAMQEWLNQQP